MLKLIILVLHERHFHSQAVNVLIEAVNVLILLNITFF